MFNVSPEIAKFIKERRPYGSLYNDVGLKLETITTYQKNALSLLCSAEDCSDLRGVVEQLQRARDKSTVMIQAILEKINQEENKENHEDELYQF
jgi:hypothetical protein